MKNMMDMMSMMKKAQQVQSQMTIIQNKMENTEFTGTAANDAVQVTMTGKHQVTAIHIKPELADPDDIEMLEDMVAAAVNEAVRKVDEDAEAAMQKITGGANFPGL